MTDDNLRARIVALVTDATTSARSINGYTYVLARDLRDVLAATVRDTRTEQSVPPFRPDPEIIGNAEGNERIRRKDQAAARAEHCECDPTAMRICAYCEDRNSAQDETDAIFGARTEQPERPRVAGWCPSCRSKALFLADGGHVTCSWAECTDPGRVDDYLHPQPAGDDPATPDADALALGELVWHTSRADESTISYIGANHVARAVLESGWLAADRARQRAEALREFADDWQWGEWANAPRRADPIQERIANGQFVTDWLRDRADRTEREAER